MIEEFKLTGDNILQHIKEHLPPGWQLNISLSNKANEPADSKCRIVVIDEHGEEHVFESGNDIKGPLYYAWFVIANQSHQEAEVDPTPFIIETFRKKCRNQLALILLEKENEKWQTAQKR